MKQLVLPLILAPLVLLGCAREAEPPQSEESPDAAVAPPTPAVGSVPPEEDPVPDEDGVYRAYAGGKIAVPRVIYRPKSDAVSDLGDDPDRPASVGEVVVDIDGSVREAKVLRSVSPEVDAAFVAWLEQLRFEPGTLNGEPVPVRFMIAQRFRER
jgi:hypothetical protein